MIRGWSMLPLLLGGCLALQERPCACPGNFACDPFDGPCPTSCVFDGDCVDGFVCSDAGTCDAACEGPTDCPGDQVCGGRGLCGAPCDPFDFDSCPDGQVCAEGVCEGF
jgi:hypothetical protein